MKRSMTILSIILLSFSVAFAASTGGNAAGGSSGASTASTSTAAANGGTPSGANANNVGTVNAGSFTGTTTTSTATTGTVGSATIAPTTVGSATLGTTTTGITTATATTNLTGVGSLTPAEINTLFGNFVAVNQLGNLSTVQLNSLLLQFRSALTNPAMSNGLIVNPLTGQEINVFANPFNTGISLNQRLTNTLNGAVAIPTATGNLAAFPTGSFPNGVALNVNFPLNVNANGTTVLINPNTNLTGGAGSTGFTSTRGGVNGAPAGVRFPTLTLTSGRVVTTSLPTSIRLTNLARAAALTGGVQTNVSGIMQRSDGTFTNVRSPQTKR